MKNGGYDPNKYDCDTNIDEDNYDDSSDYDRYIYV